MAEQVKTNYADWEIKLLKDYSIKTYTVAARLNRSIEAIKIKRARMKAARRLVDEMDLVRIKD